MRARDIATLVVGGEIEDRGSMQSNLQIIMGVAPRNVSNLSCPPGSVSRHSFFGQRFKLPGSDVRFYLLVPFVRVVLTEPGSEGGHFSAAEPLDFSLKLF